MIRERVTCNPSPVTNYYTWGLDLSGSLQGAGGIGGLVSAQLINPTTSNSTTVLYCYDANGNVSELVGTTGTNVLAHYEYSPFGEARLTTGPLADENSIRFSTKYWDRETGKGYWGYRYADDGRWLARDPMGTKGGANVYVHVRNSPANFVDGVGLKECCRCLRYEVTVGPFEVYVTPLGLGKVGIRITGTAVTDGDQPKRCTCEMVERGTVSRERTYPAGLPFASSSGGSRTTPMDCDGDTDYSGHMPLTSADDGQWTVTYDLRQTWVCYGSEKKSVAAKGITITGTFDYRISYPVIYAGSQ